MAIGMAGDLGTRIAPGRAVLEHGVEDDRQLWDAGCEGRFLGFACSQQPLVDIPDDGIEAAGCPRVQVQEGTDPGASAPDGALAPRGARLRLREATPAKGRSGAGPACPVPADWPGG